MHRVMCLALIIFMIMSCAYDLCSCPLSMIHVDRSCHVSIISALCFLLMIYGHVPVHRGACGFDLCSCLMSMNHVHASCVDDLCSANYHVPCPMLMIYILVCALFRMIFIHVLRL